MRSSRTVTGPRAATIPREDLVATPDNVVGHSVSAINELFQLSGAAATLGGPEHATVFGRAETPAVAPRAEYAAPTRVGMRHFVPEDKGTGYWDFFRPLPHVMLSITDARYLAPQWAPVQGENILKIRLVCAGRFLTQERAVLLEGPGLFASFHPHGRNYGYYIDANVDTRAVMIHVFPEAFSAALGLQPLDLPLGLTPAALAIDPPYWRIGTLTPALLEATAGLIESRAALAGALRHNFVEAKCRELLALVLAEAKNAEVNAQLGGHLTTRERHMVAEACDYLTEHYRTPPSIALLARRVGMNQTKLKAAFKHVTGKTIFDYVQDLRMRRASALLLSGDASISEVAYAVGYEHPANFTSAFKKHYGFLPRALKPKRGR